MTVVLCILAVLAYFAAGCFLGGVVNLDPRFDAPEFVITAVFWPVIVALALIIFVVRPFYYIGRKASVAVKRALRKSMR